MSQKNILLTGGAGFIGSHLAEQLIGRGDQVTIVDNCSNGDQRWVPDTAQFYQGDLTDSDTLEGVLTSDIDLIFHLAASKSVKTDRPHEQFRQNTQMTSNVLQAMKEVGVHQIAYTSSSTIYGEAPLPTPEDYSPLEPISVYGASKLADEGLLSAYAHSYNFKVWNFRFANIIGPRLRNAVIPDFIEKLRDSSKTLTILGNGQQEKSYMHIDDCVNAMQTVIMKTDRPMNTYNLGTKTTTSVTQIADIVSEEMKLDPDYEYTGGDRGWIGDVPKMRLSIEKLRALDWEPKRESDAAVRSTTSKLLSNL